MNAQSFTSAGTARWDRRLLGIDGIRDYSESRSLIWTLMSFTPAPAALLVFLAHSKLPADRIIQGKKKKKDFSHIIHMRRKVTI